MMLRVIMQRTVLLERAVNDTQFLKIYTTSETSPDHCALNKK